MAGVSSIDKARKAKAMGKFKSAIKKSGTYKGKSNKLGGGGRFQQMKAKLSAKGAKNPGALAAFIGRKSLGKAKFQKLAASGRKRKSA